jgi:hypothetical protein
MRTTPHRTDRRSARRSTLVAVALAASTFAAACSEDGGSSAGTVTTTTTPTTSAPPPSTTLPADPGVTADDLADLLPTLDELPAGYREVDLPATSSTFDDAMAEACPGTEVVRADLPDTVSADFSDGIGTTWQFELSAGAPPMPADAHEQLVSDLDGCRFVMEIDEETRSFHWVASEDGIGDQAVRGGLTDSRSSAAAPGPVGINTFFTRVVVGDVTILIRATDGWDGTDRNPIDTDDLVSVTQELVGRVEALSD